MRSSSYVAIPCSYYFPPFLFASPSPSAHRSSVAQTFAAKNPYFKETTLSKSFTITPPSSLTPAPEPVTSHDLEAPLYLVGSTPISWTSPDHDLTKKAPRGAAPTDKEEYDGLEGPGSFFNLFTEEGEDTMDVGQTFLEWWGHATECVFRFLSLPLPLCSSHLALRLLLDI